MGSDPKEREDRERTIDLLDGEYGVYILQCESRQQEFVGDFARDRIGTVPDWASEAARYETIYYIGSSQHLLRRIGAHFNGRGARFTKVFPPAALMEITICDGQEPARDIEMREVKHYREWEERYCYSDLNKSAN